MRLTPELLCKATGCTAEAAERFAEPLSAACAFYGIDTHERQAAFLAQIGHESGALRYVRELWGPTPTQQRYEGRADLGNTQPGDGARFKGHGLIQTTGRFNHARVRDRLRERFPNVPDFEAEPEALADPQWAALSAADYWDWKGLNALADAGQFETITRRINGGLNGQADRLTRWERAKRALLPMPQPQAARPVAPDPAPARALLPTPEHPKEPPMLPFVAAALPALIQMAPSLIRIFGNSPQAEKNAKAAEVVAEIAKTATGEPTVEGAVAAIAADPAKAAAYREQIHLSMGELLGYLSQAHALDEQSKTAAADRNLVLAKETGGRWLWLLGGVALLVVVMSYTITAGVLFWNGTTFSDETKALLLGQVVIFGFMTVLAFLFGSNIQNRISENKPRE